MFLGREGERQPEEGPACWLWEQNSQSRGTILGKKTEEEVAACVGGVLPKRSNGFSFSFLSKGRGQPYPAAESQALGWREEEKNLNRIGGWRLRVKEKKKNDKLLGFLLLLPSLIAKLPPLFCLSIGPVFIGKMLHGSQNWSLNFLSFFVNLIFLNFFVFFENEQYQR